MLVLEQGNRADWPQDAAHGPDAFASSRSLCSILLGDAMYGMDIRQVREILGPTQTWRVPLAPDFIGGLVHYRGEVLTTVNLRVLFGMPRLEHLSCVLVVEGVGTQYGLLVDQVREVVSVGSDSFEATPTTVHSGRRQLLAGAYKLRHGLLTELDAKNLDPMRLSAMFAASRTDVLAGTVPCAL